MTKDEALKLAREALNEISTLYMSLPKKGCMALAAIEKVLAQLEGCQCPACKVTPHESDCPVHNEPAWPNGPCDCGAQPYPDNFIDALKFDVAKRDSETQQAYEDAFVNGTGVMLGDKRIDPASIYKEQEPVAYRLHETDIYDFAGWLTTRKGVMEIGASSECGPMADVVGEYIKTFPERFITPPVPTSDTSQERVDETAKQRHEQEPVAFYVYKPTLPKGNLGNVSDGDLPWVYDQDPSSGYSARMLVYTTPPQRKPLTDEEIDKIPWEPHEGNPMTFAEGLRYFARAIEAAHGITGEQK